MSLPRGLSSWTQTTVRQVRNTQVAGIPWVKLEEKTGKALWGLGSILSQDAATLSLPLLPITREGVLLTGET